MKVKGLLLILSFPTLALLAAPAIAVEPEDLKSDIEMEIDGKPAKKPRKEKKRKKRRPAMAAEPVEPAKVDEMAAKIELAQKQVAEKKFYDAIKTLAPHNHVLPRAGLLLLAKAFAGQSDTLNEMRTFELCVAKNPKDYIVYTEYGKALIHAKRFEDGIGAFHEARTLNPRYQPVYDELVKELEKKGERYEARNVVNDMIKAFGEKPEFYTHLCRLYALDNFNEKTIEVCETAISKNPKAPENHVHLGAALQEREEQEKANQVLTHAARRFPASESVQTAMGDLYFAKKDYVAAYKYYKRAVAADGKSARAWVGYANAAFVLQKNQEALDAFVKGCKADRQQTKDFRSKIGELRKRGDTTWQVKFENSINEC